MYIVHPAAIAIIAGIVADDTMADIGIALEACNAATATGSAAVGYGEAGERAIAVFGKVEIYYGTILVTVNNRRTYHSRIFRIGTGKGEVFSLYITHSSYL